MAAPEPLVVVLDDLHWADPASIELLSGLLHRPPQARVLLALALRPRQAPVRLAAALEEVTRDGPLRRLELGPLSEAEAEALVGHRVGPQLFGALYRESDGNPFYLHELARAWHRTPPSQAALEGRLATDQMTVVREAEVPATVAASLAEELDLLPARTRLLLQGAAVVGDPFEAELAAAAAGEPGEDAFRALDELVRLDIVHAVDAPRRFSFRHPFVQAAVYAAAPGSWRLAAHRRAAEALAARSEPAAAQAHHVAYCARRGDRAAAALLRKAADACVLRAPGSAARWYRATLDLLPEGDSGGQRVEILEALARVLAGTGQFASSRAALLELLELIPAGRIDARTRLIAACAAVENLMGQHASAHSRLASALERLPDQSSAAAAELMLDLAGDAFYHADYEQMRRWAQQAHASSSRLGEQHLVLAASAAACTACALTGRVKEAQAHQAAAAAMIGALADDVLTRRLNAVEHLVVAEISLDRYHEAAAHAGRAIELARTSGQGQLFPQLTQSYGTGLLMLGRLAEAGEVFDDAIDAARLPDSPLLLAWALFSRSWTALMAGDLDTALSAGQEGVELIRRVNQNWLSPFLPGMLGSVLIEAGEPAYGVEMLVAAAGGPELPLMPGAWRAIFQETVTRGWLALRRRGEAERAASRTEQSAAALGLKSAAARAFRARAAVTLAARDFVPAAEAALASAADFGAISAPIEAARARMLAGQALAAAGDRTQAAAELERAASGFDTCGAPRRRREAERALHRLGRRRDPRRPGVPHAGSEAAAALTPRELEIAKLVRARKTNRQIAGELFLSEKTVETHLRNIFGKLGISSRTSIARALNGVPG